MGISDFGQVSRLVSKGFQEGVNPPKGGKHRLRVAGSLCFGRISKPEARTEVSFAVCEVKSYEMNKCLSLVHLTTNSLSQACKTTRHETLLGCRRILSEMNKCLSLVHLTSTFRIHSLRSWRLEGEKPLVS